MLQAGLTLMFLGAAIISVCVLVDVYRRWPRFVGPSVPEMTLYTGPIYNRHGREVAVPI